MQIQGIPPDIKIELGPMVKLTKKSLFNKREPVHVYRLFSAASVEPVYHYIGVK